MVSWRVAGWLFRLGMLLAAPVAWLAGRHLYLSTGCLHRRHQHCQARLNLRGEGKTPGTCKFCASPCVCWCHWPR